MLQKKPAIFHIYSAYIGLAVLAYWQVAFLQNSFKWDMLGCYLPWRYHVGECLQNGVFPLWNPFTHGGYPIHADLRSVWYPETFIIGLTTGYSYLTLHLLFILHLSLSGLGMYLLSQHFTDDKRAGFIAGGAYLMSGFFVGHGQEMFGIIAATWIPFVLYYFIRLQKEREFPDAVRTAVFAFLLVTGGYQAMWAILLYLLIALFITYFIRYLHAGMKKEAWQLLKLNGILLVITAMSLAVIAVTFIQVSPEVSRLSGVSIEDAWFMPFSPRSAISFLLPFATVKDIGWYDTDISMNNAYTGLIILIFFVAAVFSKKKFLLNVFLASGLIALLASFGKYTPVRGILFHYFPLFDLFRHSSFFVYFAVIAIIPAAASGLGAFLANPQALRKKLIITACITAGIIVALFGYSIIAMNNQEFLFFKPGADFAAWLNLPGRHEHIVIQATIQLIIILVFLILIIKRTGPKFRSFAALIFFEMLLTVQMNTYYTVVSAGINPIEVNHILKQRADGFPLPVPGIPVSVNTEKNASASVIWQNTNIYNKTVSFEGYNSFRLNGYSSLADSSADLAFSVLNNEVIYLSDQVIQFERNGLYSGDHSHTALFVDQDDFLKGSGRLQLSPDDKIIITAFRPGYAEAEVTCQHKVAVTLLQAWYPGWKVSIDGRDSPLFVSNKMFISTLCNPGKHIIRFHYTNQPVMIGFWVSSLLVLILISFLVYHRFRHKGVIFRGVLIAALWVLAAALALSRFGPASSYEQYKAVKYRSAAQELVKTGINNVVCNTDDWNLMTQSLKEAGFEGNFYLQNFTYQNGIGNLIACIDSLNAGDVALVSLFANLPDVAVAAFRNKWPLLSRRDETIAGSMLTFSQSQDLTGFSSFFDFEKPLAGWHGNENALDSLHSLSGRFSGRIDSINHGSFSFKWRPHLMQTGKSFSVFVRAKVRGDFSGASLFIQQMREGKAIRSSTVSSRTWDITPDRWSDIAGYGYFPGGAGENDEVRVFFWGNSRSVFYIDDFQVSVNFTNN